MAAENPWMDMIGDVHVRARVMSASGHWHDAQHTPFLWISPLDLSGGGGHPVLSDLYTPMTKSITMQRQSSV